MKILVVNGSPRGAKGNTEVLVQAYLEGAREAGAEGEVVYLKDKHIEHCIGCFSCWTKTPGVCVHKDDMAGILEQMQASDSVVYATPLYIYTVSGMMKDFMDRVIPMVQPFIDMKDGLSTHPGRYGDIGDRSFVLISNCGFPEPEHFSGLKETMRCCFRGPRLAGMICCAPGTLLRIPELKDLCAGYLDAVRQAGREVVTQGRIADQTQAVLDRPLIEDKEMYAREANKNWERMGIKRIEF